MPPKKPNRYTIPVDVNRSETYNADNWDGQWASVDIPTLKKVIDKMKDGSFTYEPDKNRFNINYKSSVPTTDFLTLGFAIDPLQKNMNSQVLLSNDIGKLLYIEKQMGGEDIRNTLKKAIEFPKTEVPVEISVSPASGSTPKPPQVEISVSPASGSTSKPPQSEASTSEASTSAAAIIAAARAALNDVVTQKEAVIAEESKPRSATLQAAFEKRIAAREVVTAETAKFLQIQKELEAVRNAPAPSQADIDARIQRRAAAAAKRAADAAAATTSASTTSPDSPAVVQLPPGWTVLHSAEHDNRPYYYNKVTGVTQWNLPTQKKYYKF